MRLRGKVRQEPHISLHGTWPQESIGFNVFMVARLHCLRIFGTGESSSEESG